MHVVFEFVKTTLAQPEIDLPFSLKVTVPVGLPAPGPPVPTMAVKVTDLPTAKWWLEETNLVVVAWLTVSSSKPDVLGA